MKTNTAKKLDFLALGVAQLSGRQPSRIDQRLDPNRKKKGIKWGFYVAEVGTKSGADALSRDARFGSRAPLDPAVYASHTRARTQTPDRSVKWKPSRPVLVRVSSRKQFFFARSRRSRVFILLIFFSLFMCTIV